VRVGGGGDRGIVGTFLDACFVGPVVEAFLLIPRSTGSADIDACVLGVAATLLDARETSRAILSSIVGTFLPATARTSQLPPPIEPPTPEGCPSDASSGYVKRKRAKVSSCVVFINSCTQTRTSHAHFPCLPSMRPDETWDTSLRSMQMRRCRGALGSSPEVRGRV
jgi:hypothetical protein